MTKINKRRAPASRRSHPLGAHGLKEAGLGSLPGGGAEVFDDRVHDEAFKGKIRGDQWLRVHEIAHELGLMSNSTMLYGHIESPEERITHFIKLREAQDKAIDDNLAGRFNEYPIAISSPTAQSRTSPWPRRRGKPSDDRQCSLDARQLRTRWADHANAANGSSHA